VLAEAGAPAPVDAVVSLDNPGDALGEAPAATAFAEADMAAIEAVEAGPTDVDAASERPVVEPVMDDATTEAFASGTQEPTASETPEVATPDPVAAESPVEEPAPAEPLEEVAEEIEAVIPDDGAPAPVDAVISLDNPGDALDVAPAATAYAASDIAAIEGVETSATDVDQAPERPTVETPMGDTAAPRVEQDDAPMAAMTQPSSVPKEAEGKSVEVSMADEATGEMETFYTFRILPRGRNQRGDAPRRDGNRNASKDGEAPVPQKEGDRKRGPRREGGKSDGRPEGRTGERKGGKPRGKPGQDGTRDDKRGGPRREHSASPTRPSRPVDPDSPFAVLQKLKDGK